MLIKKYRKGVFIVLYRRVNFLFFKSKIKYLIFKRHKNWIGWEFAKGGLEKRESKLNGVRREIFEECGQKADNIDSYNFSGKYLYNSKIDQRPGIVGQTFTLFSAELKNSDIKIDKREHSDYKWCSFEDAIKILTYPNQIKALKIVNDKLKND